MLDFTTLGNFQQNIRDEKVNYMKKEECSVSNFRTVLIVL